MKWSKYNYFFQTDTAFLLYNSLTNSFAEIEEDTYHHLIQLYNSGNVNIDDMQLKEELIKMKVLVQNELDELNEIKYLTHLRRFDNTVLSLTINPTLHCNFACSYCFEDNRLPVYMTDKVEDLIVEYLKKQRQIKLIRIMWFGGEPLMAFDRIVSLTNKIREVGVEYEAGIITNGYLLDKNIIQQIPSLNIKNVQITIDGLSATHNIRRPLLSGEGSFEQIIQNIELLQRLQPAIKTTLRVNIDEYNKEEFVQIYNFFKIKAYPNMRIMPAFVSDKSGCKIDDCLFDRKRKIDFIVELQKKYNLDFAYFYPGNNRYECAIRNPNSLVIGPQGEVYKCWNDVGNKDRVVFNLDNSVKVNSKLLLRYLTGADPLDSAKCRSCFHLPTCGGGCPYLRIENEYEGKNHDTCCYMKGNMREFLELHYKNKMKSAALE